LASFGVSPEAKEFWHKIIDSPGLRTMTMEGPHKQRGGGLLHIKVEPSLTVEHGVHLEINEEFMRDSDSKTEGAEWASNRLVERWDASMKFAEETAQDLLAIAKADV
jgi:hypothetical protein